MSTASCASRVRASASAGASVTRWASGSPSAASACSTIAQRGWSRHARSHPGLLGPLAGEDDRDTHRVAPLRLCVLGCSCRELRPSPRPGGYIRRPRASPCPSQCRPLLAGNVGYSRVMTRAVSVNECLDRTCRGPATPTAGLPMAHPDSDALIGMLPHRPPFRFVDVVDESRWPQSHRGALPRHRRRGLPAGPLPGQPDPARA